MKSLVLAGWAALASTLAWPTAARAEDPLDTIDGTEEWEIRAATAADQSRAWGAWRSELRRWEAGVPRHRAEKLRMRELVPEPAGSDAEAAAAPSQGDLQERIEAARRLAQAGAPDERDASGQVVDEERPDGRAPEPTPAPAAEARRPADLRPWRSR